MPETNELVRDIFLKIKGKAETRRRINKILSPVELSDVKGGGTLVLCRWENVIMQVIISVEGHFINLIK